MYLQDILDRDKVSSQFSAQKILFLFAHPDDEQYMAGTIQEFLSLGHTVYVAYSTSGANGTDLTGLYPTPELLGPARELEAVSSLTNLGVTLGNILPLRQDASGSDAIIIRDQLITDLAGAGISGIECIISFDHGGIYGTGAGVEHSACQLSAISYFRMTDSVKSCIYFTIPTSDIDDTGGDLTQGNSVNDNEVDAFLTLTAGQVTKKQDVIDYHVTQYAGAGATTIKNHFSSRPYEYFKNGQERLNAGNFSNREYLKMIFGG